MDSQNLIFYGFILITILTARLTLMLSYDYITRLHSQIEIKRRLRI